MKIHLPPILLLFIFLLPSLCFAQSPRGFFIDCGATTGSLINGLNWVSDQEFIATGSPKGLLTAFSNLTLSTVRTFPNNVFKKFCYEVPVVPTARYLVRTTYFYGGVNGVPEPPVFDQMVDGTFWGVVNTTEDYAKGDATFYEGIFAPRGKTMSVCLGANTYTESDPFISALEVVLLANSLYNATDFGTYALKYVARHSFGYNGPLISYPDDLFNRYWFPFGEDNVTTPIVKNISVSEFWNQPPSKVFQTDLRVNEPKPLELNWPPASLPNNLYYISLYFADERNASSFNVTINGVTYYQNLTLDEVGSAVFTPQWPLAGITNITLIPVAGSTIGPVINAGEVFELLQLGGRTLTRDVTFLEMIKGSFQNPPADWNGDPCLPRQYPWTGVTCSAGPRIRIISLNLTGVGISGLISPAISNLTALSDIWLGNNDLTGPIPDLSNLKLLKTLHLEDNNINGDIPQSLGDMSSLSEIFLQNNNLTGNVPSNLVGKSGLDFRFSGNPFLTSPSPPS